MRIENFTPTTRCDDNDDNDDDGNETDDDALVLSAWNSARCTHQHAHEKGIRMVLWWCFIHSTFNTHIRGNGKRHQGKQGETEGWKPHRYEHKVKAYL